MMRRRDACFVGTLSGFSVSASEDELPRRDRDGEVWVPTSRWKSSVGSEMVLSASESVNSAGAGGVGLAEDGIVETSLLSLSLKS